MADDYFEVKGMQELERTLDGFTEKFERKLVRSALREGAKAFLEEAKRLVHVVSGKLRDSLKIVARRPRNGMPMVAVVAGGTGKDKPWYARLVEFGTAPHRIDPRQGGKALAIGSVFVDKVYHPGAAPKPFMRPAFDTRAKDAVQRFADYLRKRLGDVTQQG